MQLVRRRETPIAGPTPRAEIGQGLVEFALLLPLVVVMFFGIIQFGFLFGGQIALVNAVREGTRYASTSPVNSNPTTQVTNAVAGGVPGYTGTAAVAYSYCYYADPAISGPQTYSARIQMNVTYGHPLFIPLVGRLVDGIDGAVDNRFTVTVREDMRVESMPFKSPPSGLTQCANP